MPQAPSPATLKKYGLYAILSFFISLSMYLLADDLNVRSKDVYHERQIQKQLQQVILDQVRLQSEQRNLLKDTVFIQMK